jgi:type VI secretion system secreted protein VgrG
MEDSKDNEQIYIHGQRDMQTQVERDVSVAIGRDQSSVIKRDQSLAVTNNRSIHVKQNESHIVDVDQKLKVGANRLKEVVGNQTASVTGVHTLNVKGAIRTDTKANRIENTTGTESRTIGGNQVVNITGNLSYKAAKMVFEAGHIEHKVTGSSSVVHESPNGPYTIMANKFSVLSNTDASILAVGKINYTSMESNTTVMGTNTSGYIGHSSNTAMGLARTTFLGLAMNTFLGASINNTAALQFEAVLAAKLSVSLGPHLEMHPLKMYCPPGGAAAAAGGNVVGEGVAFWATLGALEGMAFGLMSAMVGFGELSDQYSAAKAELRDAARDAAAAGHPGLADRLNRLADGGSLEGPDPTSTQLPPAPTGSEPPADSSEPPPDSSEPPPNSSEPPPDSSEEPNMSEGPDSEGFERNFSDPDDPGGEAGGGGGGAGGGG